MKRAFWHGRPAGKHENGNSRIRPFHFSSNQFAVHLRHLIVENHCVDRQRRKNLKSFAAAAGGYDLVAEVFQNYFADLEAAQIIVDTQESFLPPGHVKLLAPRPKLERVGLRRVPLSATRRRASREALSTSAGS